MEFVRIGDEINTGAGFIKIVGRHFEDFEIESYEIDEDGEPVKVFEQIYTRHDLNAAAKEGDGKNHNIWWEE